MQWLVDHSLHIMIGLLLVVVVNIDSRLSQIRDLLSDLREIGWESPGWRAAVERHKLHRESEVESYLAKARAQTTETR